MLGTFTFNIEVHKTSALLLRKILNAGLELEMEHFYILAFGLLTSCTTGKGIEMWDMFWVYVLKNFGGILAFIKD